MRLPRQSRDKIRTLHSLCFMCDWVYNMMCDYVVCFVCLVSSIGESIEH